MPPWAVLLNGDILRRLLPSKSARADLADDLFFAPMSLHRIDSTHHTSASDEHTVAERTPIHNKLERALKHGPSDNRTSLLLQLPRELLDDIIYCAAAGRHVRDWIMLGQICSALRAVLLGLHHLWASAIYSWPDGRHRDKLLERAGSETPLWLHVLKRGGAPDAAQFAIKHLHRARVVNASQPSFVEWFVQNADSTPLPFLEKLILKSVENDPAIVALTLLSRNTPQLKHVALENVLCNFGAPALTTLDITFRGSSSPYSTSQFLDLLRHSGRLQTLQLKDCLPYFSNDQVSANTVSLPDLRTLYVRDAESRECVLQFWRMLAINSDADVIVEFPCDAHPHPDYTGPPAFHDAALFKNHLRGRWPTSLDVIGVNGPLDFSITSSARIDKTAAMPASAHASAQETLTIRYIGFFRALPKGHMQRQALHCVCTELGLFDITHFFWNSYFSDEFDSRTHWTDMLRDFDSLEYLFTKRTIKRLCVALTSKPQDNTSASPLLVPKLREWSLNCPMILTEEGIGTARDVTTADFFEMMQSRAAGGHPLSVLKFTRLRVDGPAYKDMSALFLEELRSRFPECRVELD